MPLKNKIGLDLHRNGEKKDSMDYSLLVIILMLLAFGLVMVFSASSANAHYQYGDATYFFKRQLIWAIVGIALMLMVSKFSYKHLKRYGNLIFTISIVALLLVFVWV